MNAVKPIEYTHKELIRKERAELDEIAQSFNIAAHLFKNKPLLVNAIMAAMDDPLDDALNDKQEQFCQLYARNRDTFGNGVQSYIEAYDINTNTPGAYEAAMSAASSLLMDIKVLSRIQELLSDVVVNDTIVDAQTAFWIMQKAHPMASIAAIREYNKVKKRVDDKTDSARLALIQNNFNVSINDERGQQISQKVTDYVLEITKAPQGGSESRATSTA